MSIAKAANFLSSREKIGDFNQVPYPLQGPASRLMSALRQQSMISLFDVPKVSGVSPESVLPVIKQLISDGHVEVVERNDRQGEKYLSLIPRSP